jgi:NodT family efflux transporter outer membrane factor (OMF) lipoprotein
MENPSRARVELSARFKGRVAALVLSAGLLATLSGCGTSIREYVHNGFKVGPNYCPPDAAVAERWIDADDAHLRQDDIPCCWWKLFGDPVLNDLVCQAYGQNLTLKEAGYRILQARAQLAITIGNLFPQQQTATGSYQRIAANGVFSDSWRQAFNLNWEVDFWGRYRRAVAAAEDTLDAAAYGYDSVLVTMLGDVAANYVTIRTSQEQIELLRSNVELQRGVLQFVERRFKAGFRVNELDVDQARSNLAQIEAGIPALQIEIRQANDRLCVLLGIPTVDLVKNWPKATIPQPPAGIAVGLPADLLRRRPDVRRAELQALAQGEQVGIAEADLYPSFFINGTLGWQASKLSNLYRSDSLNASVGPSFQWNLLNYGRIVNSVRWEEAYFCELVTAYQRTVLQANQEVEDGLVVYLRQHERIARLSESVDAAQKAVKIVIAQFEKGAVDFNRYATIAQDLVSRQVSQAQARGALAAGLIQVYRALGGGWEIRCQGDGAGEVALPEGPGAPDEAPKADVPDYPEQVPAPKPAYPEPRRVSRLPAAKALKTLTVKTDSES